MYLYIDVSICKYNVCIYFHFEVCIYVYVLICMYIIRHIDFGMANYVYFMIWEFTLLLSQFHTFYDPPLHNTLLLKSLLLFTSIFQGSHTSSYYLISKFLSACVMFLNVDKLILKLWLSWEYTCIIFSHTLKIWKF